MKLSQMEQYIRNIELNRQKVDSFNRYPFNLPSIRTLTKLEFHPCVTYIVGENGSGKSTVLEAIAVATGFNPEGGTRNNNFSTRASHSDLSDYLTIVRGVRRPLNGFFLRAESFYNLATDIEELDKDERGPRIIDTYGGVPLHEQSHGEAFFAVFMNKFRKRGIYILDEPESALSPSRQMAMISRMHQLVEEGSQFIIATHSPIIMSYPDSIIYQIKNGFERVKYNETDNYQIMKAFVNNTEKMLGILMG
ncbi:MAG TPA: AAA family ATPase [Acetivibrio sp.]|nr:AAA family ATPase [Acetivibrio sp.]